MMSVSAHFLLLCDFIHLVFSAFRMRNYKENYCYPNLLCLVRLYGLILISRHLLFYYIHIYNCPTNEGRASVGSCKHVLLSLNACTPTERLCKKYPRLFTSCVCRSLKMSINCKAQLAFLPLFLVLFRRAYALQRQHSLPIHRRQS